MLYMANHGSVAAGYRPGACCRNGRLLAEAQLRSLELYEQDAVIVQSDNYYMAEAFGCRIRFQDDALPDLEVPAIDGIAGISTLKPVDPGKDGRMHVYLEAIRILKDRLLDEVAIRACGTGPFVLAGHLMGLETFILALADAHYGDGEVSAIKDLLEIGRETLTAFVRLQLQAGATVVQLADSTASLDLISPDMYEQYVFPVERQFFSDITPLCRQYDAVSLLHICGDNTKVLHLYAQTGADIVEIDHKVDLAAAKVALRGKAAIVGNLDPSSCLLLGSVADVETAARSCIDKAAGGGGFILGSGCEVPINAPPENVRAAIRIGKAHLYPGGPA
jgi:MtaA/CmuA family methyltransferase